MSTLMAPFQSALPCCRGAAWAGGSAGSSEGPFSLIWTTLIWPLYFGVCAIFPIVLRICRGAPEDIRMTRECKTQPPVAACGSDWGFFLGPGVSIFNFNGLVHCVSADRAPTCLVADRRKTKPSDREARAGLRDHDPPTPKDKAEGSA